MGGWETCGDARPASPGAQPSRGTAPGADEFWCFAGWVQREGAVDQWHGICDVSPAVTASSSPPRELRDRIGETSKDCHKWHIAIASSRRAASLRSDDQCCLICPDTSLSCPSKAQALSEAWNAAENAWSVQGAVLSASFEACVASSFARSITCARTEPVENRVSRTSSGDATVSTEFWITNAWSTIGSEGRRQQHVRVGLQKADSGSGFFTMVLGDCRCDKSRLAAADLSRPLSQATGLQHAACTKPHGISPRRVEETRRS